jgi:hypothetical protein
MTTPSFTFNMKRCVHTRLIALAFWLICVVVASGQTRSPATLGETDATWSSRLGKPIGFERGAWRFEKAQVYTRTWYTGPRERTGANYAGYSPSDYSVRYIEFVRVGLTQAAATSKMREMLPRDCILLSRRATSSGSEETYRSRWLLGRIRPLLAGNKPCISPWGYGPGIIRVRYHRLRGRAVRVVADLGEPHEVPMKECAL